MLGAASPAMAAKPNNKGKAKGHVNKPAKPAPGKAKNVGITGGGTVTGAEFSIQAKPNSKAKGHFNYTVAATATTAEVKIRCKGFDAASYSVPSPQTSPATATVTFKNCKSSGVGDTPPSTVTVTVTDAGKSTVTPPPADTITFTAGTAVVTNAPLTDGNVKIR